MEENSPSQNNVYVDQLNLQQLAAADWTSKKEVLDEIHKRTVAKQDEAFETAISELRKLHMGDKVAIELLTS